MATVGYQITRIVIMAILLIVGVVSLAVFLYLRLDREESLVTPYVLPEPHPFQDFHTYLDPNATAYWGGGNGTLIVVLYRGAWDITFSVGDNERCENSSCTPAPFRVTFDSEARGRDMYIFESGPAKEIHETKTVQVTRGGEGLMRGPQLLTIEAEGAWSISIYARGRGNPV